MKRYELMSKEEIIDSLYSQERCGTCPLEEECKNWDNVIRCAVALHNYLTAEIKMKKVHRYELIKSPEDFDKILKELDDVCYAFDGSCGECKYNKPYYGTSAYCFANYLKEEIEVEDE